MLKCGGHSARILLIIALLSAFVNNFPRCDADNGLKYKGVTSPRFDPGTRNAKKRAGFGVSSGNNRHGNAEQEGEAVNKMFTKIQLIADDGRMVLLACRQKCPRQRGEVPRWIEEFNVEYNTSATEDSIEYYFHTYRTSIKWHGIDDRLRANGVVILYLVGGRVFYFKGDFSSKAAVWEWLLSFERVHNSPRLVNIVNGVNLDAWITRATTFCINKTQNVPNAIDLMVQRGNQSADSNDTLVDDERYEYILEPATLWEKRRLLRMEIEAKRAKNAKNYASVTTTTTTTTQSTMIKDGNRSLNPNYRKFYDWKSKYAKFSTPTEADPTVEDKNNADDSTNTAGARNSRSDITDMFGNPAANVLKRSYWTESAANRKNNSVAVKAKGRKRRTTLNFSRAEIVEANADHSSRVEGVAERTRQKILLIVHHWEECPEFRLGNLVRAFRDDASMMVAEARRPLNADADVILRQRLPGLYHKCRLAILLYHNEFIQLPDEITVAELYNFSKAWPSEPLDACAWPLSPHRIRAPLTDIQIEYFKEQIQIQRIEFSRVFIVVGIIGGLAVVALAISIFWGLNGTSFVSKR